MRISPPTLALEKLWTRIFHSERLRDALPTLRRERAVMSPTNGHANDPANSPINAVQQFAPPPSDTSIPTALAPNASKIKELIASLEVPFHPSVIEWRVANTSKGGAPRGQVMPYADQRAYTDRLNALVTPAGWTRRYAVHTSANLSGVKIRRSSRRCWSLVR